MGKTLKPARTFEEQAAILESRNMLIDNHDLAVKYLSRINYYRFSGYSYLFQNGRDRYKKNTHFEAIIKIMEFDRKMRHVLLSGLETAEIYARTQIAYWFSIVHDNDGGAYYDPSHFVNQEYHADFLKNLKTQIDNNHDKPFVLHHVQQYDGKMPLWAAVELISFSKLSQLYSNMKLDDQKVIAGKMNMDERFLRNWLHCFSVLRNTCAHYGRLYSAVYSPPASLGPKTLRLHSEIMQNTLFAYIIALLRFLPDDEDRESLRNMVSDTIHEYEGFIDLWSIGFPENWETLLFDPAITLLT